MAYKKYLFLVITLITHGTTSYSQLKIRNELEEYDISNSSTTNLYVFPYTPLKNVYISCQFEKLGISVKDYKMVWEIVDTSGMLYPCEPEKGNKIHYITKFSSAHNGNKLYCKVLNNRNKMISVAEITLKCDPCINDKTVSGLYLANCAAVNESRTITSYVNEKFSYSDRRLVTFKKDEKIAIYCKVLEEEHYSIQWKDYNKRIFEAGVFRGDGNIISILFKKMPEDMDNQSITCLRTSTSGDKQVTFNFQLTSNLALKVYDKNKNKITWMSHRENKILYYKNKDDLQLTCEMTKTADVQLILFKDETNISYDHLKKPKRPILKLDYSLGILTQANDSTEFRCEMIPMSGTRTAMKRIVHLKFQEDEVMKKMTVTTKDGRNNETTEALNKEVNNSGLDARWIATIGIIIVLCIIIIILIVLWRRPRRVTKVKRPYENFQNSNTVTPESQQRATEPPEVQPTYGSPVDQYSYVDLNTSKEAQTQQETYCTPFVPTIDEMYTKPTPKKGKVKNKAEYDLPSKYINYANLRKPRDDDSDPGYSNLRGNKSDTTSETYSLPNVVE